jgi:hypothetical protein
MSDIEVSSDLKDNIKKKDIKNDLNNEKEDSISNKKVKKQKDISTKQKRNKSVKSVKSDKSDTSLNDFTTKEENIIVSLSNPFIEKEIEENKEKTEENKEKEKIEEIEIQEKKEQKQDYQYQHQTTTQQVPVHLNDIKRPATNQPYVSVTPTHLVIHNTFQKTYNCSNCSDEPYMMNQTIIPPKVYMFYNKEQAQEFYSDYINDIDEIDERCKKGQEIEHVNYCICGVLELDDDGNPVFFNNKKNHIYLLEVAGTIMSVPYKLKHEIHTMNSTISNLKKYKTLSGEQINKYIQLGKMCEECLNDNTVESDDE